MTNGRGTITTFLAGLGIGMAIALLFAPLSGEETREWLMDNAQGRLRQIRRQGRRWVYQAQDVLDNSEDRVRRVLRTSKNALETVAARLD